jgi:lipopolysaccharide biosynthesis protein
MAGLSDTAKRAKAAIESTQQYPEEMILAAIRKHGILYTNYLGNAASPNQDQQNQQTTTNVDTQKIITKIIDLVSEVLEIKLD